MAPRVLALTIPGEPNAHPARAIADAAAAAGLAARTHRSIEAALRDAAATDGARVVICGSLYLGGDVLAKNGTPPD
jgi:dihydrofolate synthase/folylpolyglutamate synthase